MMRKQAAAIVADLTGTRRLTVENNLIPKLQAGGVLPGIRDGDGEVDATYRVNLLLGVMVDRAYGVTPADAVRHWRALPFAKTDVHMVDDLGINVRNAGAALDWLVDSLLKLRLTPIVEAKLGAPPKFTVEFCDDDHMNIIVSGGRRRTAATFRFGMPDNKLISRTIRVEHGAFERLAAD
jgi:hypothetical protein